MKEVVEFPLANGKTFNLVYAHPSKLLAEWLHHKPKLHSLWSAAMARSPSTADRPWRLVVGFDEFTPGNAFHPDHSRKCMVLSFSFMELGQLALSVDDAWITPLVVRTSVMKNIIGGWSHVLRVFLETLLLGPHGLETSGVPLVLNGVPVLFFAKLGTLLSDGDGHRTAMDWRGAQCLKPCVKHFNVWKKTVVECTHCWPTHSLVVVGSGCYCKAASPRRHVEMMIPLED